MDSMSGARFDLIYYLSLCLENINYCPISVYVKSSDPLDGTNFHPVHDLNILDRYLLKHVKHQIFKLYVLQVVTTSMKSS